MNFPTLKMNFLRKQCYYETFFSHLSKHFINFFIGAHYTLLCDYIFKEVFFYEVQYIISLSEERASSPSPTLISKFSKLPSPSL